MILQKYCIQDNQDIILRYVYENKKIYIYISKDYGDSSINFKMDGELKDVIQVEALSMEIPVYEYKDSNANIYMQSSFEYLNTYYSISGMLEQEEFEKILENIWIKNV